MYMYSAWSKYAYHFAKIGHRFGQLDVLLLLHVGQDVRHDGVKVKLLALRMLKLLLAECVAKRRSLLDDADVLVLALCQTVE